MSETLLEKQMNRMSQITDESIDTLPQPDEFGQVKLPYKKLREICNQRSRLGYASGFFYGIACMIGRKRKQT